MFNFTQLFIPNKQNCLNPIKQKPNSNFDIFNIHQMYSDYLAFEVLSIDNQHYRMYNMYSYNK